MANTNGSVSNATPNATRVELVYCPLCTHTVPAEVILKAKRMIVRPGQKCARCHSPIDAGYVFRRDRAA
jgi:hypothetical protein